MVGQTQKIIRSGLTPLRKDKRDFKLGLAFGFQKLKDVPDTDFVVAEPLEIKDQFENDMCTAYASCAVSEDQEGVPLSPEYTFAKTKQLSGDWKEFGANLRDAAKSHTKFGALEKQVSPFHYPEQDRNFIANWNNWPAEYDQKAKEHQKDSFFSVDGPYDKFDNIRAALWKFKDERRSQIVGAVWRASWMTKDGVVPTSYEKDGTPHAFKIFGQKTINGKLYLVAQLSNGTTIGDRGIFYVPREVANREFTYGNFMFKDIDPEQVKTLQQDYIALLKYYVQLLTKAVFYKLGFQ